MFCNVAILVNMNYLFIIIFYSMFFLAHEDTKNANTHLLFFKIYAETKLFRDFQPYQFYFSGCHLNYLKLIFVNGYHFMQFGKL